jgi:hypothetical protein
MANLTEEISAEQLDQHLIDAIEEGEDLTGCPYERSDCACSGYARHPRHGRMATVACYDETCMTHGAGKLDYGIEPRPLRWMKKPKWKEEYQGIWVDGRQIRDYENRRIDQLVATTGFHLKIEVILPMGKA